jgi:hypothetical protein
MTQPSQDPALARLERAVLTTVSRNPHQDLARQVAQEAQAARAKGKDAEAQALLDALHRLGFDQEGDVLCDRCHSEKAYRGYIGADGEPLCDGCYEEDRQRDEA